MTKQERLDRISRLVDTLPEGDLKLLFTSELLTPKKKDKPVLKDGVWNKVGNIGVDAGLVWVGDPCYILHREDGLPNTLGNNWGEFCDTLINEPNPLAKSFKYDIGHEGLGVCVSSGLGDGTYDVFVKTITDSTWGQRIAELKVVFIEDDAE